MVVSDDALFDCKHPLKEQFRVLGLQLSLGQLNALSEIQLPRDLSHFSSNGTTEFRLRLHYLHECVKVEMGVGRAQQIRKCLLEQAGLLLTGCTRHTQYHPNSLWGVAFVQVLFAEHHRLKKL